MKRGRFIVFEGIDGSGKSTQALRLRDRLCAQLGGGRVILTTEPTRATTSGELLRRALAGHVGRDWPPEVWASLFIADRVAHVTNTIAPALDAGITVVCDRYALSTLVYQHHVRGAPRDWIAATMRPCGGYVVPDVTILLDIPVDVALGRVAVRGGESVYERREDVERAAQGYDRECIGRADWGCVYVVGGAGTEDEVAALVWRAVDTQRAQGEPSRPGAEDLPGPRLRRDGSLCLSIEVQRSLGVVPGDPVHVLYNEVTGSWTLHSWREFEPAANMRVACSDSLPHPSPSVEEADR